MDFPIKVQLLISLFKKGYGYSHCVENYLYIYFDIKKIFIILNLPGNGEISTL